MPITSFEDAERHLDRAWYAAVLAATFDLVIGAMSILGTRTFTAAAAVYVARVLLMFGLAYGLGRRSAAAILLLLAGILRTGFDLTIGGLFRVGVGLVFVYFYARGVEAVFAYHRLSAGAPMASGGRTSA